MSNVGDSLCQLSSLHIGGLIYNSVIVTLDYIVRYTSTLIYLLTYLSRIPLSTGGLASGN